MIQTFLTGVAFCGLGGRSWSMPVVCEIRPTTLQTGFMRISLSDFPVLARPLGSLRISTSPLNRAGTEQLGIFPPVIINAGPREDFHVLSAQCTHANCTVRKLDAASQTMTCPCHGSVFSIDGRVLNGPASAPLREFCFTRNGDFLDILMPDDYPMFYDLKGQPADANRLELSFVVFEHITYEVYFRPSNGLDRIRVPFATDPNGPLNQTELPAPEGGAIQSIFVERPSTAGFFQVAMKTLVI